MKIVVGADDSHSSAPAMGEDFADALCKSVWKGIEPLIEGYAHPRERADLEGYLPDVLVQYPDEQGADLMAVGSRGRGHIASLVRENTSHRVINHASCDWLVARDREREE